MPTSEDETSIRIRLWAGLLGGCLLFVFWMSFSSSCIPFYRQDNVTLMGPLLIEAARQVQAGQLPFHTDLVGGGGGTPLVSIMQPAVLYPLKIIPALLFGNDPELMMNIIVSLHLALFGVGGWYLGTVVRAPTWACLVALLSLGFSGCFVIGAGNYEALFVPYTFLPWIVGGIIRLGEAETAGQVRLAHAVTAIGGVGTFFSGGPSAAFYGAVVVACGSLYVFSRNRGRWTILVRRLCLQAVVVAIFVVPLLWQAQKVYAYFGRQHGDFQWEMLSVPLGAYLGLFLPCTSSIWLHVGLTGQFSDFVVFSGLVPAWFCLIALVLRPRLLLETGTLWLVLGISLLILLLSPPVFGLTHFFARTPILDLFKFPFRGLPAFHVMVVFLFVVLVQKTAMPGNWKWQAVLFGICVVACPYALGNEFVLARPGVPVLSWFVTERFFEDPETWDDASLQTLRSAGYVMNLCRAEPQGVWFQKPRLFFSGNLGAQFGVHTVHRYVFAAQSEAYQSLGMFSMGLTTDWPAVKMFIETGPKAPLTYQPSWENGIGPRDLEELRDKTFVGAIVVETMLTDPVNYFRNAPEWRVLETTTAATVFVRKGLTAQKESAMQLSQ